MSIRVEIEKRDRIHLRSPYSPTTAAKCKSIPGANWSKTEKAWTYPLSIQTCHLLRQAFGDDLEIGPRLWSWAAEKNRSDAELKDVGSALDADLNLVPKINPDLYKAMESRYYQRSGTRFLSMRKRAGNLDGLGLGKTVVALATIMESGKWESGDHLVIATATSMRPTWMNQILRWTNARPFIADGSETKRLKTIAEFFNSSGPKILVINPEMLRTRVEHWCSKCSEFEIDMSHEHKVLYHDGHERSMSWKMYETKFSAIIEHEWDSIIADECKYLIPVRPHSKKKMPQQVEGMVRLKSAPDGIRMPVTGTPFRGKEKNIFGILCWMRPDEYKSYWQWIDTYFEKDDNGFGVTIGGLRKDREDLFYRDLDVNFLRRTRQEVRSDLPVNTVVDIWVDMSAQQKRDYERWLSEGVFSNDKGRVESIGTLAEITRARQFAFGCWDIGDRRTGRLVPLPKGSPKLDWIMDKLDEMGIVEEPISHGDPDKLIIVSQFTEVINMLHDFFASKKIPSLRITGSNKKAPDGRLAADVFNSPGGERVLLLNTDAGGTSLTLDEYCDVMIIIDEKFVDDDQEQVKGRIDNRGSRVAPKTYYMVRTNGTVEEGIAKSNLSQGEMQRAILDQRRGVEFVQKLMRGDSSGK